MKTHASTTVPAKPGSTSGPTNGRTSRRTFLAGAGAAALGTTALGLAPEAFASGTLSTGDAAILRFLAAAEILETDLWQQYNELGGIQDTEVPGGERQSRLHQSAVAA